MPPRSRRRKRRARKRRTQPRIQKALGGFPASQIVKLTYAQEVTLDSTAGFFAENTFRLNSIFDPDFTGGGHQPMNRDIWGVIYGHYTVLSTKMKATYAGNATAANVIPNYYGLILDDDGAGTSPYTAATDVFENPNASALTWRIAGVMGQGSHPDKNAGLVKHFSAKKFFGVDKPQDGAAYGANIGSNPAKGAFGTVWTTGVGEANGGSVVILVQIEYTVLFDQLVQQDQN